MDAIAAGFEVVLLERWNDLASGFAPNLEVLYKPFIV